MNNIKIKSTLTLLLAAGIISLASCGSTTEPQPAVTIIETSTLNLVENDTPDAVKAAVTTAYKVDEPTSGEVIAETTTAEAVADTTTTEAIAKTTTAKPVITTSAIENTAVDTTILHLETPQLPTMDFDTVNDFLVGQTYCVGRNGVTFTVDEINTDETGFITVKYTLVVDGEQYKGEGGRFASGVVSQFTQDKLSPCLVSLFWCDDTDDLKYASVTITPDIQLPEPLVLSGESADEFVITKPEYIETEDMVFFFSEGAVIKGNFVEKTKEIMKALEKETGWKFFNESEYASLRSTEHIAEFAEVFRYVDYGMKKFHVYVVPYETSVACAWNSEIVLNFEDTDLDNDCSTLIHELSHALQRRNGMGLGRTLDEGYATYMTDRMLKNYSNLKSDFSSESNYSYYDVKITAGNAESTFAAEHADDYENYLYGYRFVHFLFDQYGDDIMKDISNAAEKKAEMWEYDLLTNEKAVNYIKECTSDNVFAEFAQWLKANEEMFDGN